MIVYVLTEGDDLYNDDAVLAVFSGLPGAKERVPGVVWEEGCGLIGDFWHCQTTDSDGYRRYWTIYPFELDPDDLLE